MAVGDEELARLAGALTDIAERLADVAIECLHDALAGGEAADAAVATERRITRARRAVEKAALLLVPPEAIDDPFE
jgi:hypothetical protein